MHVYQRIKPIHTRSKFASRHSRNVLKFLAVFSISFTTSGKLWLTWPKSSHWNHSIWLLSHWVLSGFRFTCIHLIQMQSRESCSTVCLIVDNCNHPAFHFEMRHCMVEWSAAASVSSVGTCSFWEQPQTHLLVFAMNLSGQEDTACESKAWIATYVSTLYIYNIHKPFNIHNTIPI